jgi:hypothetical protein
MALYRVMERTGLDRTESPAVPDRRWTSPGGPADLFPGVTVMLPAIA